MTAPEAPIRPPRQSPLRRVLAFLRNTWRGLTSMRTALMLLFLLALAAIPGALLPQRSLNAQKVDKYIADRPTLGHLMDRVQLFDVFSSFWFTAIYALLFISLIGCIAPRVFDHYKALRTPPVAVPRNLSRLPHHYSANVEQTPEDVVVQARKQLRGWRVIERSVEKNGRAEVTLSAEKGYFREFGNLVFHMALVGLLVAVAVGKMFGYEGNVIVIADGGPGFCTTSISAFDSFRAGNLIDGTGLTPLCVRVKNFKADYLPNGEAQMFTANVSYQTAKDLQNNTWRDTKVQVNHPLRVEGDRLYVQGHGYAPTFTVTYPNGETRTQSVQWQPTGGATFLSSGVMRFDPPAGMYPSEAASRKHQIALEGLFAPTAFMHGTLLSSSYPGMNDPAVAVDVYRGESGLDTGRSQSVFSLDPEMIKQGRLVKQARVNLKPGQFTTLSDGTKVRFDGAKQWANLQVSHDPAQDWVLVFAVTMMAGLLVSLVVKRRRIWVRAYREDPPDGPDPEETSTDKRRTVVEMGGLARTDQAGWGGEFDRLRVRLLGGAPTESTGE